jgi:hypothetical protein
LISSHNFENILFYPPFQLYELSVPFSLFLTQFLYFAKVAKFAGKLHFTLKKHTLFQVLLPPKNHLTTKFTHNTTISTMANSHNTWGLVGVFCEGRFKTMFFVGVLMGVQMKGAKKVLRHRRRRVRRRRGRPRKTYNQTPISHRRRSHGRQKRRRNHPHRRKSSTQTPQRHHDHNLGPRKKNFKR